MSEPRHVVIVGGGVIGIACAWYLRQAGREVTIVDRGTIGGGCSHGNCGLICPSHILPLAEPGAAREALASLLSPGSAFRVKPRVSPALWSWMWQFWRRCNEDALRASGSAIQPLLRESRRLYEELIAEQRLECEWESRGLLFVYESHKAFEAYSQTNRLLTDEFGEPARRLERDELLASEPALSDRVAGGWYYQHDAHLRPDRLISSWRSVLREQGVEFIEQSALEELECDDSSRVRAAHCTSGALEGTDFVIATGAWTPQLADILNVRIPGEPGKGYSVTLPRPDICPQTPIIFPERHVAVTPFTSGLRLGSIMEFAGYDESLRPQRLQILRKAANAMLRSELAAQDTEAWTSFRPMTWDSTPVIGRCPGLSNVYLATGHNMLGLSMAPATGRLVRDIMTGTADPAEVERYRPERLL